MGFLSKRAKTFSDIGINFTPADLKKLYELEYKLSQLSLRDLNRPSSLKAIERWKEELSSLLRKGLFAMREIFQWWIDLHNLDEIDFYDEAKVEFPGNPRLFDRAYDMFLMGERTRYDDFFRQKQLEAKKKMFDTPPFKGVIETYKQLSRGSSGDIGSDMVLFQKALNTAHYGGLMVNHLVDKTGITKKLMDDLSGGKYVEEWNSEIKRFSNTRHPISKWTARSSKWWLSPEGKLYDAGRMHEDWVDKNLHLFGVDTVGFDKEYELAFKNNWIRIGNCFGDMYMDVPRLTSDILRRIQGVLPDLPVEDFVSVSSFYEGRYFRVPYSHLIAAYDFEDLRRKNFKLGEISRQVEGTKLSVTETGMSPKDIFMDDYRNILHIIDSYRADPGFYGISLPEQFNNDTYLKIRVSGELIEKISKDMINKLGFVLKHNSIKKDMPGYFMSAHVSDDTEERWAPVSDYAGSGGELSDFERRTYYSDEEDLSGYTLNFIFSRKKKEANISKEVSLIQPPKRSEPNIISKRAKDPLSEYKKKRERSKTPEPFEGGKGENIFVIHHHKSEGAAGEHFDLRLQKGKFLESWAIPKAKMPSKKEKLLATQVEPHPLSYAEFKGSIPE